MKIRDSDLMSGRHCLGPAPWSAACSGLANSPSGQAVQALGGEASQYIR